MISAFELGIIDGYISLSSLYKSGIASHLQATGELAAQLAAAFGLDEASVQLCRAAGRVHDIGLIGVDRSILETADMLVDAEWDLVMGHPEEGAKILRTVPGLIGVSVIVEAHHERIDGTGYPHGLVDNEIPIESRLISIVDAFHAMTQPTSYRRQLSPAAALDELDGNAGSQFDRELVDAFLRIFPYKGATIHAVA